MVVRRIATAICTAGHPAVAVGSRLNEAEADHAQVASFSLTVKVAGRRAAESKGRFARDPMAVEG